MTAQVHLIQRITQGAADVSRTGNGLPLETFKELARRTLNRLAAYNSTYEPVVAQDTDYLARLFQSVYENLQDIPEEIE